MLELNPQQKKHTEVMRAIVGKLLNRRAGIA
jgi:hypothetical protein